MRGKLGVAVLGLGVGVLGLWGSKDHAPEMEAEVSAGASAALGSNVHPVDVRTSGRDIFVSGIANSEAEKQAILARMADVNGRRVVKDELTVLPVATPYVFNGTHSADGKSYSGNTPTEAQRGGFADRIGDAAGGMTLAAGMPDGEWPGVVGQGLDGLGELKDGTLTIVDRDVTLSGLAALPANRKQAEARLAGLPEGYTLTTEIEVEDDGSPMRLSARKGANGPEAAMGKLPMGLGADGLGLGGYQATLAEAKIAGPTPDWDAFAATGVTALEDLDVGTLSISDTKLRLNGTATRAGKASAEERLAALGAPYAVATDISYTDDGRPFALDANFDGTKVMSAGKFPYGMSAGMTAAALGVPASTNQVDIAEIESADGAWPGFANQGVAALGELDEGHLTIQGQEMILTGVADRAGKANAEAAIAALPAGYSAKADISYRDDGRPLMLNATADGATTDMVGKLPYGMSDADLSGAVAGPSSVDVDIAEIDGPDAEWPNVAATSLAALDKLENGTLDINNRDIVLKGTALTPDHGAQVTNMFAALPPGYTIATDLDYVDDGTPPSFEVDYAVDRGASVSGKLPAGLTAPDIASALNLSVIESTATEGLSGAPDAATEALTKLSGWLPELDQAVFTSNDAEIALSAVPAPGVDTDLLQAGLVADFPDLTNLELKSPAPVEDTSRVNALTGQEEVFSGVAWIPNFQFQADADNCAFQANNVLTLNKITFVTGRAQLSAKSVRAVNAVTGVINQCLETTDLQVEVQGHTDSDGNSDNNQALSQRRADAVLAALLERGLDPSRITARGYGEASPIASNFTDEGKAANRRTEIKWLAAGAATQTQGD